MRRALWESPYVALTCVMRVFGVGDVASHRCSFHDVPPDGLVPAALAEVQQVVHHHLADQVVSGETVEVVDGEVQLASVKLGQRHAELERLIKHRV